MTLVFKIRTDRALLVVGVGVAALIGLSCLNNKQQKITSVLYNMETVLEGRNEIEKKFSSTFSRCNDRGRERVFVVTDNGLTEFDNLGLEINLEKRDYIDTRNELDFYATIHLTPKYEVPAEESKQIPFRLFDRKSYKWPNFQPFNYTGAATITAKKEKGKWYFWSGRLDVYRAPKSSCAAIINETPIEDDLYSLSELEQRRLQADLAKQMDAQRIAEEKERRMRETEILEHERELYVSALENAKKLVHKVPRCGDKFFALEDDFFRPTRCFYKLLDVQESEVILRKAGYGKSKKSDYDEKDEETENRTPRFIGTTKIVALKAEKYCYTLTRRERRHLDPDQRVRTDISYVASPATRETSFTASSFTKIITIECNGDDCSIANERYFLPCNEIIQSLKQSGRSSEEQETKQR